MTVYQTITPNTLFNRYAESNLFFETFRKAGEEISNLQPPKKHYKHLYTNNIQTHHSFWEKEGAERAECAETPFLYVFILHYLFISQIL